MGQVARKNIDNDLFDLPQYRCQWGPCHALEDRAQERLTRQEVQGLEHLGGDDILQTEATVAVLAGVPLPRQFVQETSYSTRH